MLKTNVKHVNLILFLKNNFMSKSKCKEVVMASLASS